MDVSIYQKYINAKRGIWTKETYRTNLSFLKRFPNCKDWNEGDFYDWLDDRHYKPTTLYTVGGMIKQFCLFTYGKKHPGAKLVIKVRRAGPQRSLTIEQVERLLQSFDAYTIVGIRDIAIATLLLDTGLRAAELCRADIDHLDLERRRVLVITKGANWNQAIFSAITECYLRNWLAIRRAAVKNIFVSTQGPTAGHPLTPGTLLQIVGRWGKKAGIPLHGPHDLRRTFATLSTRLGAPSRIVQVAGRWSSIEMVQRYTETIESVDFEPYFPVVGVMNAINHEKKP